MAPVTSSFFSGFLHTQRWFLPPGPRCTDARGYHRILRLKSGMNQGGNTSQNVRALVVPWKEHEFYSHTDPSATYHSALSCTGQSSGPGPSMAWPPCPPPAKQREPAQWFGFAVQAQKTLHKIPRTWPQKREDTHKGTRSNTNDFYPYRHSRLSYIRIHTPRSGSGVNPGM